VGAGATRPATATALAAAFLAGCLPEARVIPGADGGGSPNPSEGGIVPGDGPPGADRHSPVDQRALPPTDSGPLPAGCANLRPLPLPFTYDPTPPGEDFTFDNEGYLLLVSGNSLMRTTAQGPSMLLVPNVVPMLGASPGARGLRMLASGEVIIADLVSNVLVRVEPNGARRNLSTIPTPNGIALGPGGKLYVTSLQAGIYRVDPATGAATMLARLPGADGLTFSLDFQTLYVSNVVLGGLYTVRLKPDGSADPPQLWLMDVGQEPDGMVTDECGNVYVTGFRDGGLRRVTRAGAVEVVAQFGDVRVPAVNFGSGRHGWDAAKLYVMNMSTGGVYGLTPGVRPAPPPPP
jgi:hypothetical protein